MNKMSVQDQFEIENGILKAYTGADAAVEVPEGVETIADGVFKGMAWLLSVKLPSSLKKIGSSAFKGCRQLKEINFPDGLTEVGDYAFHRCHGLEELIFPESMTKVGRFAFLYCDKVEKVVMEGPKNLGTAVFSHNMSLREISLCKDLDFSNFSDEVFEGCVLLRTISLSGEVFEVDNLIEAMSHDSPYPDIIKAVAKSVYHSLEIEDGVLNTFNINLKTISLPEGIKAIGKGCFFDKKGIESITLPKSLREIKANAFLNCMSLTEVTFQNEDAILDDKAFRGCCNLKKVNYSGITYDLEDETCDGLAGRIRDQVLGDFYISGRILKRYLGNEEYVRIPKEVEIIGEGCFAGNEQLKTVECPDGLTEIRECAFKGCLTMQTIILPAGLKRVEREAFAECKKLLKCNLPVAIEYIGEYAFRRCFTLPAFDPRPEKTYIDPYAFYKAGKFPSSDNFVYKNTEEKTVGKISDTDIAPYAHTRDNDIKTLNLSGLHRIGAFSFASCPELTEVDIDAPDCVIERKAFSGCPKLRTVNLHVKELEPGVFSYCRNLTKVSLNGIKILPAECFAGCESLELNAEDLLGVVSIGKRSFERCDSIKEIELDDVECGYHAFADCASLEAVTITPKTRLKSGVFTGCTQIGKIVFDSKEYDFSRFSDCLNHTGNILPYPVREVIASVYSCFDIRDRKHLAGYTQDASRVTVPEDIEEIGNDVFRDHLRLREINIPKSVRTFGSHAFSQTGWLDDRRGDSDTVIVNGVLLDGAGCMGEVIIPDGITRIASWCFAGNINITELVIPYDRIIIENLAFRNCINLKKITDRTGKEYVLENVSDLTQKDYPDQVRRIFTECINCFKLDGKGNLIESTGNITDLNFPEGIKSICGGVYKDCHLLESIRLSSDTAKIGRSAFESSKWLKSITNTSAVETLGALAFSGCQSLEYIDPLKSLEELGNRCFEHCSSLKEIQLSDRLEVIPERAFFRCKSLKNVYIPSSVQRIEAEAFAFCDSLEEVRISKDTEVAETAFAYAGHVVINRY